MSCLEPKSANPYGSQEKRRQIKKGSRYRRKMILGKPAIICAMYSILLHRCHHIGNMVIVTSVLPYWYNDYGPHRQCCPWQTHITGTHQWPLDRHVASGRLPLRYVPCFFVMSWGRIIGTRTENNLNPQPHPTFAVEGEMGWIQLPELLSDLSCTPPHLLGEVSLSCQGKNERNSGNWEDRCACEIGHLLKQKR